MSPLSNIVIAAAVTAVLILAPGAAAQQLPESDIDDPDPRGAFLKSLVLPGWGHLSVGESHKNRGLAHLGAEAVLIGSFFGLTIRGNRLDGDINTLSRLSAGVDISGRERAFKLAVGDFNSLADYNDYQLRTRNWDRLLEDIPENRWEWQTADDRLRYRGLRQDRDQIRNQLPALAGLMVVNRVISAISAYNRSRKELDTRRTAQLMILPVRNIHNESVCGALAKVQISF